MHKRPASFFLFRDALVLLSWLCLFACGSWAQDPQPLGKEWLQALKWRSIGPANMGGRITAISVYDNDPSIWYVATASGGLLKTTNNGVTFRHQFDEENTVSIGDVCVAPSNPNIVWVGTGEANPRNSVSYGDGVYKSTDGGKSWQNMGLKKSFQIGKILIHPTNPDIVYVGALGRLYGPSKERGLYKTTDGGKTWDQILFVDENTGIIDMRMHPNDPETLLVAAYERRRGVYDFNDPIVKWGPGSGLYKTSDGGNSFQKITEGLPTCDLGRIGLDWHRADANTVYMVLESEKIGKAPKGAKIGAAPYMGIQGTSAPNGARLTRVFNGTPADKAGFQAGDIIVEFDKNAVKSYQHLVKEIRSRQAGDKASVKVKRGDQFKLLMLTLGKRSGFNSKRPFTSYLGGQKENRQERQGKEGFQYGGVYKSEDGGDSWVRVNSLNPRPMYFSQIRVDPTDPKYVYVLGISLHRSSDGGVTFKNDAGRGAHPDHHALWIDPRDGRHMILGNDGGFYVTYDRTNNWDHYNNFALGQFYHVAVGPKLHYHVYGGLQDNGTWGGPAFTNHPRGPLNSDWFRVYGGDGFRCAVDAQQPEVVYCAMQNGRLVRRNFKTGAVAVITPRPKKKGEKYRWNWNTPYILSNHNPRIYYCAAQYVFKSLDRGNDPEIISPEIALTKKGSATALSESPLDPNVLYVGTDDGALWVTTDGGKNWTNIAKNVGLPGPRWVASLEASRFEKDRCYVVFDGHRSDDDDPHVYVTEDFGKTWNSLRANLPWGATRVLREDFKNPNLLYVGTEFGAWCSLDRGANWISLNTNLPTVAVHEIAIHPTAGEIVAATHGRSLWVLDVSALRDMKVGTLCQKPQLYEPKPTIRWISKPARGHTNHAFSGKNRPGGAQIYYSLPKKVMKAAIKVFDVKGQLMRRLKTKRDAGLHVANWNLTRQVSRGKGKRPRIFRVAPGTYRVVLEVDGTELVESLQVMADPSLPPELVLTEEEIIEEEFEKEEEQLAD